MDLCVIVSQGGLARDPNRPFLADAQWEQLAGLLPRAKPSPKGGRPRADDRSCLEAILWVLRAGARWRDLPDRFPSPATCWRRLNDWRRAGTWPGLWRTYLATV